MIQEINIYINRQRIIKGISYIYDKTNGGDAINI